MSATLELDRRRPDESRDEDWHDGDLGLMLAPPATPDRRAPRDPVTRFLVALVRLYQLIVSPWLGRNCRFEPSCSRYAVACLQAHGAARGSLLSVKRLCKCHPLHPGGWDPPPPAAGAATPGSGLQDDTITRTARAREK